MTQPASPIKFYTFPVSGNTHRVELLLRALDLPFERIDIDLRGKQQKTEAFLAMNPFGQVPVIDDNGTIIWDSVAILTYLALTYDTDRKYLPAEPKRFAEVMAWVSKASGPIAFGLAAWMASVSARSCSAEAMFWPNRHTPPSPARSRSASQSGSVVPTNPGSSVAAMLRRRSGSVRAVSATDAPLTP